MSITELTDETSLEIKHPELGDLTLTTEEAQQYSNKVLRRMAAEAPTDSISGRDVQLEWYSFFARQRTLSDYTEE